MKRGDRVRFKVAEVGWATGTISRAYEGDVALVVVDPEVVRDRRWHKNESINVAFENLYQLSAVDRLAELVP